MAIRRRSVGQVAPEWFGVSPARPCPVCGAAADCAVAEDDPAYVRCCTIHSSLPIAGGGWLHVLASREPRAPV
jgi:hypothetical protein